MVGGGGAVERYRKCRPKNNVVEGEGSGDRNFARTFFFLILSVAKRVPISEKNFFYKFKLNTNLGESHFLDPEQSEAAIGSTLCFFFFFLGVDAIIARTFFPIFNRKKWIF